VGQINGTAITVEVPYGTVVTGLIPTITYTGSSISPLSGQAQNFSNPKTYTVTAADNSTQDYTVTVNVAQGNAKAITEFKIASPSVTGTINGTAITVTVPYGTNVTSLIPTITHTGASVDPESGTAQDFSSPKIYTVRAADNSIQEYTVTVTAEKNNAKAITAFNFTSPNVTGTVNESAKTVTLNVPYETVVTSLTPTITVSAGATVSPESGTATNFTNPVTYTVTAENGDTQAYTVTVNKALNSAKAITAFKFTSPNVTGTVNETEKTIAINVPYGTSVTSLTPTITYTGASVSPASGTATNFTNPVTYTVTAADGSTQDYTVTVTVAKNSAKKITAFSITNPVNKTGTVNESAKTVTINDVPYGTVVTAMIPSITVSAGATVSPTSGTATNFTNPVTYTVTAADGSTQDYKVTVNVAKNSAKDITAFNIGGASGSINGTAITVTVSYQTTSVTSLIPTITVSPGATVYPTSGTATDFTNPVTYTVWAEDGTSKDYTVTVTVGSPPALKRPITEAVAGVTFKLGYVERGSFVHGSGNTVDNLTTITTSYWMGETEVTQALYQAVMGNNPSYFTGSPAAGETQGNRPVEQVYWYHAIAFCNLLSLALGYTPVYSVNGVNWSTLTYAEIPWDTDPDWDAVTVNYNVQGYRLPTEAEWGWAAMGGAEGLVTVYNMNGYSEAFAGSYSGADVNNYAWTSNNSGSKTHEVKKKLPNKIGLYDMTGNVGEWVYDWYGTYPTGSRTDPRGPDSGEYRMFCSGAWDFAPYQCSFSWRTNYMRPRFNDSSVGLRVILPDPGR
jgi:formylglycine-generating enzyme required for sulfatase activity/phage-related protein